MKFASRRFTFYFFGLLITWLSPLLLGGGIAHAQRCEYVPNTGSSYQRFYAFAKADIIVPPRAPNGTVLASEIFEYGYKCQANPSGWRLEFSTNYYPTDIPGVFKPRTSTATIWGTIGFRVTNADTGQVMSVRGQAWSPPMTDTYPIQGALRIKIEVIKVSDAIYNFPNAPTGVAEHNFYIYMFNNRPNGEQALIWSFSWVQYGKYVPMVQSCNVLTPSVPVPLQPISASKLSAIGTTAGDKDFNIALSCKAGSNVYVTLTDLTDTGNLTNQLTLTQDSSAKGVKLRILRNGNPVNYGPDSAATTTPNQWYVGPSATTTSIPLSAQYIATGQVSPGTVKGVATFTMSYQ
jgi:type 1 fimbria pilin